MYCFDFSRIRTVFCSLVSAVALASLARADTFVLDPLSTSWPDADDVLGEGPVGGPPQLAVPGSALGLGPQDVIDAISDGRDEIASEAVGISAVGGTRNGILFSVTRQSVGGPGTGVNAERVADAAPPAGGAPYGHPSDIFLWDGTAGTNSVAPAPDGWGADNGDEAYAGLVNPAPGNPPFPGDDVNGHERRCLGVFDNGSPLDPGTDQGGWDHEHPDDHENPLGGGELDPVLLRPVFFSLRANSPTLAALGASPGDILVAGGSWGSNPSVFLSSAALGIPAGAEVDALSLRVAESATGSLAVEKARYSVASWTTGFSLHGVVVNSGADVIEYDGATSRVAYDSFDLGLLVKDDVDALEGIALASRPDHLVVPFGDAEVEPRADGFAVTGNGNGEPYGVHVELPATLSRGATFAVDELGEGASLAIAQSVVDTGYTLHHEDTVSQIEIEGRDGAVHVTATYPHTDGIQLDVYDGETVVRSFNHPGSYDLDLTLNGGFAGGPVALGFYLDLEYSGDIFLFVEELDFGGQDLGEICLDGDCASGDRVRISALCDNEVVDGVFALGDVDVTARGFAGFGYQEEPREVSSSAMMDGSQYTAHGAARIEADRDGLTVYGIWDTSDAMLDSTVIGDSRRDGVDISMEEVSLVTTAILVPAVQFAAWLDGGSSETGPDFRAWLGTTGPEAMSAGVEWGSGEDEVTVLAYQTGGSSGDVVPEFSLPAGRALQFSGLARLVGANISSEGFQFRFAESITLHHPTTGEEIPGDEFHFLHGNADLAGAELSRIGIRGTDLGSIRLLSRSSARREVFRRGDTDGNSLVDLSDAVRSLAFLFLGGPEPACFDAADADDSGKLDIADPVNTLSVLFLGIGSIPAPGPFTCASDPTADGLGCESYETCD